LKQKSVQNVNIFSGKCQVKNQHCSTLGATLSNLFATCLELAFIAGRHNLNTGSMECWNDGFILPVCRFSINGQAGRPYSWNE
jgi:hypothetical protein